MDICDIEKNGYWILHTEEMAREMKEGPAKQLLIEHIEKARIRYDRALDAACLNLHGELSGIRSVINSFE